MEAMAGTSFQYATIMVAYWWRFKIL